MKMCMDHWNTLRTAIAERGLSHLVARSGKDAADAAMRQLEGTDTKADFDPLMNANWAIMAAYMRDTGLIGMTDDRCPLCEVEKSREGLAENWIRGCAEDQLQQARELKLVPEVQ